MNTVICKNCFHYGVCVCQLNLAEPCPNFIDKNILTKVALNPRIKFNLCSVLTVGQKEILRTAINNLPHPITKEVAYRYIFLNENPTKISDDLSYDKRNVERYWSGAKYGIIVELLRMLEAKSK